ncbi:MAG: KilA-N domain-containing protein [Thiomargarita sp.]|nr:KilA-N domain-containing protein [Thiomargarita sp.]
MKTNQMMEVNIGGFTLPIGHKTQMGSLNALWAYGNRLRKAKGLSELDMKDYLRSPDTIEFLLAVEKRYGTGISKCGDSPQLENSIDTADSDLSPKQNLTIEYDRKTGRAKIIGGKLSIIKTKRGKYGGTWAHLQVLTHAAGKLSADFLVEIIHVFLNDKILGWRDIGGDNYISLNIAIDNFLPGREATNSNMGIYINTAKLLKAKILGNGGNWNSSTPVQLTKRAKFEEKLISFLEMSFIRDWVHFKEVIHKL